jgi:beta-glucosidase
LTYTTFEHGPVEVVASGTTAEPVVLRSLVSNTGARAGTEVAQLYVRDEVASVARPRQQLVGFARVQLEPGSDAAVTFEVHPSRLAFYDEAMRFVTEPGLFTFAVGGAADAATAEVELELAGEVTEHRQSTIVPTTVTVSPT